MSDDHDHIHETREEAIACAMTNITSNIAKGVHAIYPEAETDPQMALAIAACLLTLSAKYASHGGFNPVDWLEQQVQANKDYAAAQANADNALNN